MKILLTEFKRGQIEQIKKDLNELKRKGQDNSDVFINFLGYFKQFVKENWDSQGRPYGKHWKGLTDQYKKRKARMGYGRRADLTLMGTLKSAAMGGAGYYEKIEKNKAKWGIDHNAIPYAAIHQYGGSAGMSPGPAGIPARPYWGTMNGNLPGPLQQKFIDLVRKKIELTNAFKGAKA